MRSVVFTFRPEVPPERQDSLLAQITLWDSVVQAGRLSPRSRRSAIARMACAVLKEETDADAVVKQLSELPEVESASVPAERHLI